MSLMPNKKIIVALLLMLNGRVYAEQDWGIGICKGTDDYGKKWNVTYSPKNHSMIVNGDTYNIVQYYPYGTTKKMLFGFATDNFVTEDGRYVYNEFCIFKGNHKNTFYFAQHNAVTFKLVSYVQVYCHWEN